MLPLYGSIKKCQTCGYMFAVCPSASGTTSSPLESVPFAPALGRSCLVFPSQRMEAAALTDKQASSSRSGVPEARNWVVAADQIAQKPLPPAVWFTGLGLSSALSFSLCRDFPAEVSHVLCGTAGAVRPAAPSIVLELWKPAVTDLRQTAALSALSARVALL